MGRIRIYTDRRAGMIYETRQRSGALFQDWVKAGVAMPGYGTCDGKVNRVTLRFQNPNGV